jgi:pilus assembly protein CpaE
VAGKRILIVDPDPGSRAFVGRALRESQYDVLQAASGTEGLTFAWRDRPDLIIMDPTATDIVGEAFARKIRQDSRSAHVPLVALSSDQDDHRAQKCIEAGFNEYIKKSAQAIPALTETVGKLLGGAAKEAAPAKPKDGGALIVFFSAKGGTGTSSLCANLAMNLAHAEPEKRVVVVDMVLPIGSIAQIVGYEGQQNLVTVADLPTEQTTPQWFREQLPELNIWKLHLVAGSPDPDHSLQLNISHIEDIINDLKSAFDYVVVDVGRALSKITLPLLQQADLVTLIVSTDLSTVALSKTMWEYLKAKGINPRVMYTILNRAVGLEGVTKAEAETMIGIRINTAMPYLGGNFALANNQHQPYILKFPTDTATIVLKQTAKEMAELVRHLRSA